MQTDNGKINNKSENNISELKLNNIFNQDYDSDSEELNFEQNFDFFPIDYIKYKLNKRENENLIFNLDDYECPVCLHLANSPIMCSECEKLICFSCLEMFKSNRTFFNCPNCCTIFSESNMSRIVKNTLLNIPLNCPNNPTKFSNDEIKNVLSVKTPNNISI